TPEQAVRVNLPQPRNGESQARTVARRRESTSWRLILRKDRLADVRGQNATSRDQDRCVFSLRVAGKHQRRVYAESIGSVDVGRHGAAEHEHVSPRYGWGIGARASERVREHHPVALAAADEAFTYDRSGHWRQTPYRNGHVVAADRVRGIRVGHDSGYV